jgi:carboxypeptidase D
VQKELGTPLNFTAVSSSANDDFIGTGDAIRTAGMKSIEYLLDAGVKVAMMYGDRDYRCNWLGGEQLSLQANWTGAIAFREAGYETMKTSTCYNGGVVRQHGNLSFTRVFDSGHDVASYQPRTAFEIFTRSMLSLDVATGKRTTSGPFNKYSSQGPLSSFGWKNKLPTPPPVDCNLYYISESCTVDQYAALANGTADVVDFNVARITGDTSGGLDGS